MIYKKFMETVKEHNLIEEGDSIIVALSGGPDSVCMLHLIKRLSEEMDIKIYAAHLNHQIRGLDAHMDALYVANLCEKLDIPAFIKSVDVPGYCRENKLGIEDGARKIRYELFEEIKAHTLSNKIAIGHNKNDQAETVLMKIIRGTGLKGLRGIDYRREDNVIRPILDLEREEIELYCDEHGLKPRIDKTNLEAVYSRNKIRLKILPYIKKEFNENIVDSIVRMSENMRIDIDFIEKEVNIEYDKCVKTYSDNVYIFMDNFDKCHKAIKTRIIFKALNTLIDSRNARNMIEKKHIDDIFDLIPKEKQYKMLNLPNGLYVYRFLDYILISKKEFNFESIKFEYTIKPGESVYIPELGKNFVSKIIDSKNFDVNNFKKGVQYLNFDQIKGNLTLRNRRQGDKIKLLGGTKKIKELFIGEKIPRENRSLVPIISDENGIVSVFDYRINSYYRINENTEKILEIRFE